MKKKKVLIVLIIMACILVIGIPYINVEIKTYKYGDQFKDRYTDTNMIRFSLIQRQEQKYYM